MANGNEIIHSEIQNLVEKFSFKKLPTGMRIVSDKIIDSIGLVDLVLALESGYGVSISSLEMTPENFDTVDSIFNFLKAKREVQS